MSGIRDGHADGDVACYHRELASAYITMLLSDNQSV